MKKIFLSIAMLLIALTLSSTNILANNTFDPEPDITKFYLADSDGDGIIDIYDKNPNFWDVSDRDLRFFMELAYKDKDYLNKIFAKDNDTINKFNFAIKNVADVRELVSHWKVVEIIDHENTSGFFAVLFRNKNKLVIAFRGTNNFPDYKSDASIAFGTKPWQVDNLLEVKNKINTTYNDVENIYLTGHSLGGYLAAYMASDQNLLLNNPKLHHSAVFNAPGITSNLFASRNHKQVALNNDKNTSKSSAMVEGSDKRFNTTKYKFQPYGIHGDVVSGLDQYQNTRWNNQVNSGSSHSSTNFVATKADDNFKKWFSTGYRMDSVYKELDSDNDGIKDVDELRIGTDPYKIDTDGDGIGDKVELLFNKSAILKEETVALNELYYINRTGGVNLKKREEFNLELFKNKAIVLLKEKVEKYSKQIKYVDNKEVKYEVVDYPKDLVNAGVNFNVTVAGILPDGTRTNTLSIPVKIEENKNIPMTNIFIEPKFDIVEQNIDINEDLDLNKSFKNLPKNTTITAIDDIDTTTIGKKSVTVQLNFNDKMFKTVVVKFNVNEPSPTTALVEYKFETIDTNKELPIGDIEKRFKPNNKMYTIGEMVEATDLSNINYYDENNDGYWTFEKYKNGSELIVKAGENIFYPLLKFRANTYVIKFIDRDKTISEIRLTKGEKLSEISNIEMKREADGLIEYKFIGWNKDAGGKKEFVDQNTIVDGNANYYAVWGTKLIKLTEAKPINKDDKNNTNNEDSNIIVEIPDIETKPIVNELHKPKIDNVELKKEDDGYYFVIHSNPLIAITIFYGDSNEPIGTLFTTESGQVKYKVVNNIINGNKFRFLPTAYKFDDNGNIDNTVDGIAGDIFLYIVKGLEMEEAIPQPQIDPDSSLQSHELNKTNMKLPNAGVRNENPYWVGILIALVLKRRKYN